MQAGNGMVYFGEQVMGSPNWSLGGSYSPSPPPTNYHNEHIEGLIHSLKVDLGEKLNIVMQEQEAIRITLDNKFREWGENLKQISATVGQYYGVENATPLNEALQNLSGQIAAIRADICSLKTSNSTNQNNPDHGQHIPAHTQEEAQEESRRQNQPNAPSANPPQPPRVHQDAAPAPERPTQASLNRLHLTGFFAHSSTKVIYKLMAKYGTVASLLRQPGKGAAMVTFTDSKSAKEALAIRGHWGKKGKRPGINASLCTKGFQPVPQLQAFEFVNSPTFRRMQASARRAPNPIGSEPPRPQPNGGADTQVEQIPRPSNPAPPPAEPTSSTRRLGALNSNSSAGQHDPKPQGRESAAQHGAHSTANVGNPIETVKDSESRQTGKGDQAGSTRDSKRVKRGQAWLDKLDSTKQVDYHSAQESSGSESEDSSQEVEASTNGTGFQGGADSDASDQEPPESTTTNWPARYYALDVNEQLKISTTYTKVGDKWKSMTKGAEAALKADAPGASRTFSKSIYNVAGDGNCAYTCIAKSLNALRQTSLTQQDVRNQILQYVRRHEDETRTLLRENDPNVTLDSFKRIIQRDWANDNVLQVASRTFAVPILIFSNDSGSFERAFHPSATGNAADTVRTAPQDIRNPRSNTIELILRSHGVHKTYSDTFEDLGQADGHYWYLLTHHSASQTSPGNPRGSGATHRP